MSSPRFSIRAPRPGSRPGGMPRPSWKKYQLATESTKPTMTSRTSVRLPRTTPIRRTAAHRSSAQPRKVIVRTVKSSTPISLSDRGPVGGVAQVDVLAALGLGHVAAQGGDHQQDAEQHGDGADDVGEEPRTDRVAEADAQRRGVSEGVGADDDQQRGEAELGEITVGCLCGDPGVAGGGGVGDVLTAGPAPRGWWRRARPAPGGTSSNSSPVLNSSIQPLSSRACCHSGVSCISSSIAISSSRRSSLMPGGAKTPRQLVKTRSMPDSVEGGRR